MERSDGNSGSGKRRPDVARRGAAGIRDGDAHLELLRERYLPGRSDGDGERGGGSGRGAEGGRKHAASRRSVEDEVERISGQARRHGGREGVVVHPADVRERDAAERGMERSIEAGAAAEVALADEVEVIAADLDRHRLR